MKPRHIIMALVITMVCFFACSKDDNIWEHTNIKLLQKTTMCYWDTMSTGLSTYDYQFIAGSSNTIGMDNQGIFFKGKQNANLILVQTFNNNSGGVPTGTGNYTYEYDNKNRVTKMTVRYSRILEFVTNCTYVD